MKDSYDFSKGRKNPYAKRIKEEGYSILIHYAPGQSPVDDMDKDDEAPDEKAAIAE
jgi:hypothetical protein